LGSSAGFGSGSGIGSYGSSTGTFGDFTSMFSFSNDIKV